MPVFSRYVPPEHTEFGERLRELKKAQAELKTKRAEYCSYNNNFQCVEEPKKTQKTEVIIDNDGAAHTVQEVVMPLHCLIFHKDKECKNVTCPHKSWNTKMVGTFMELQNARHERNLAFWNLFGLKTRVIDIQAYRQLKKQKQIKAKEVFGLCCEYTIAEGAEAVIAQEKYESALKEYDALVAECTAARRKAWGRNK